MRDKTDYEWVFEESDPHGDIIDPMYCNTYQGARRYIPDVSKGNSWEIALVRFEGNEEDGESLREYAYIKNKVLPVEFPDGYKVPKRYHKEFSKQVAI